MQVFDDDADCDSHIAACGTTAIKENAPDCSYVHRVGRTGRAGQSGVALTLFTAQDTDLQTQLCSSLRKPFDLLPASSAVHAVMSCHCYI